MYVRTYSEEKYTSTDSTAIDYECSSRITKAVIYTRDAVLMISELYPRKKENARTCMLYTVTTPPQSNPRAK